jgi:hypothetical protein
MTVSFSLQRIDWDDIEDDNEALRTCVAVFHLPHELTATDLYASPPSDAASSRSADIAISLPMMTAANSRIINTFTIKDAFPALHKADACAHNQMRTWAYDWEDPVIAR